MAVNYNRLWKLLIDKKMKKKDLVSLAGVSTSLVSKLGKDENVTVEVLAKICNALDCTLDDIVEIMPDNTQNKQ